MYLRLCPAGQRLPFRSLASFLHRRLGQARYELRLDDRRLFRCGSPTHRSAAQRPHRRGLEALIARPVFYELAEMATQRGDVWGVSSNGAFFPIASPGGASA